MCVEVDPLRILVYRSAMRHAACFVLTSVLGFVTVQTARAETPQEAELMFETEYWRTRDSRLLLKVAEAQEKQGRKLDAATTLHRYLEVTPDAKNAEAIEARIYALRGMTPPPKPVLTVPPTKATSASELSSAVVRKSRASPAFWTAVGVAGAGTVAGTILGVLALNQQNSFDRNPAAASADHGERLALFTDLAIGVAVAAAVTAWVLYLEP